MKASALWLNRSVNTLHPDGYRIFVPQHVYRASYDVINVQQLQFAYVLLIVYVFQRYPPVFEHFVYVRLGDYTVLPAVLHTGFHQIADACRIL
jgi:hypothetical protein